MSEIFILGASGRIGRAVATQVAAQGHSPVLVGRDRRRLAKLAPAIGGSARAVQIESFDQIAVEIAAQRPTVVVNTIGPFAKTGASIARACLPASDYVDISNELDGVTAVLALQDEALAARRSLVAGAGFGVLGTESVVLELCAGRAAPAAVRVDALGSVGDHGPVGDAVAASVVGGLAAGSRRYRDGELVRTRVGADRAVLDLPDGSKVRTAGTASGELEAAHRASGAPAVVSASSMVPSSGLAPVMLPLLSRLLAALPPLRRVAQQRLAKSHPQPTVPEGGAVSWAHAEVSWPGGETREGWLRLGEAMDFTAAVAAEVSVRLADGGGRPGAFTPGALFGPELALAAGGEFVLE